MSEQTTSFVWVIISGLLMIVMGLLLLLLSGDEPKTFERITAVAAVVFGLFVMFKQRWALIGTCLTLLFGIAVFFIQTWWMPIIEEDLSLIWPNLLKMLIGIAIFTLIGRERIDQSFFMR